jgi:hypothetical protein
MTHQYVYLCNNFVLTILFNKEAYLFYDFTLPMHQTLCIPIHPEIFMCIAGLSALNQRIGILFLIIPTVRYSHDRTYETQPFQCAG